METITICSNQILFIFHQIQTNVLIIYFLCFICIYNYTTLTIVVYILKNILQTYIYKQI